MARLTAALLVVGLILPAPGWSLFGLGSPSRSLALLWIPDETFSSWESLAAVMEKDDDLRLTVAVSPVMIDDAMARACSSLIAQGRLEIALRLSGDPILPIIAAHPDTPRPHDPLNRIAIAREEYRRVFGRLPAGFAPGGGLISPGLFRAFKAMRLQWVAVGGDTESPWPVSARTTFIRSRGLTSPFSPLSPHDIPIPEKGGAVYVIDEAQGLVPAGGMLSFLEGLPKQRWSWSTVTALIADRETGPDVSTVHVWAPWTQEDYESWWDDPALHEAWVLYGKASTVLQRYRNSGRANLKRLETAKSLLYKAQSSRFFRLIGGDDSSEETAKAEEQFRGLLASVFSQLKKRPPEALFKTLLSNAPDEEDTTPSPRKTHLTVRQGADWLSFENPSHTPSAGDAWRIDSIRLDWDETDILFSFTMGALETPGPDGEESSDGSKTPTLLLHSYIDVNHVVGAGSTRFLEDEGLFLEAQDAWEYALTISGEEASLVRWAGRRVEAAKAPTEVDLGRNEIRVRIPRNVLRGNPLRWGYIVTSLTVSGSDKARIVGILGTRTLQKSLSSKKRGSTRLSAVRVTE